MIPVTPDQSESHILEVQGRCQAQVELLQREPLLEMKFKRQISVCRSFGLAPSGIPAPAFQRPARTTYPFQSLQHLKFIIMTVWFFPPFSSWFSFTATLICPRRPCMKQVLPLWCNTWDQVRPRLLWSLKQWATAASALIDSMQVLVNTNLEGILGKHIAIPNASRTHTLALTDTELTPHKQII